MPGTFDRGGSLTLSNNAGINKHFSGPGKVDRVYKIQHYLGLRGEGSQFRLYCVKCPKTFDFQKGRVSDWIPLPGITAYGKQY